MKYALIHSADNNRIVQVSEEQFPVHQDMIWVECGDEVTSKYSYVDDSFEPPQSRPEYQKYREAKYPPIADQLDMIYHAGQGGEEFQAAIEAVKSKYPKEEEV
jgi:hypothetical protein